LHRVFQGHSKLQGLIGYHDFLLVCHINYGPTSYCFRDKVPAMFLTPRWRGFSLDFCNNDGAQKPEWCSYQSQQSVTICAFI